MPPEFFSRLQLLGTLLRDAPAGEGCGRLLWRNERGEVMALAIARPIVIGRDPGCDLALASARISRRHCVVRPVAGSAGIEDLDSTNGTFVNGTKIRYRRLRDGDAIELGGSMLFFSM